MRESSLQKAFIQAVDRCRLLTQRNRGVALDCHYNEYSNHYNLCNDLARRIKEAVGGIHSAANIQLRQQFNMQFSNNESSQVPLVRMHSQRVSQNFGSGEDQRALFELLKKASEPLSLSQTGEFDAISDGMESIVSTSEDEFESIKDSSEEERTVTFESIDESSESGGRFVEQMMDRSPDGATRGRNGRFDSQRCALRMVDFLHAAFSRSVDAFAVCDA